MLNDLRYRMRALLRRRELDAELAFHLEQHVTKLMPSGLSRREAERRARVEFGGVERIREEARAARGVWLVDGVLQDVRYAWRGLSARPGFAATVVLTLGLGISASPRTSARGASPGPRPTSGITCRSRSNARRTSASVDRLLFGSAGRGNIVVRVDGRGRDYLEALRQRLQRELAGEAYVRVAAWADFITPQLRSWRIGATMFRLFAGLALVLASTGLYSVIAYGVAQRTREFGVRIALGASVGRVMRMVVAPGVLFAVGAVLAGSVTAWFAVRWVEPLLFAVAPRDPLVFGGVAAVLVTRRRGGYHRARMACDTHRPHDRAEDGLTEVMK